MPNVTQSHPRTQGVLWWARPAHMSSVSPDEFPQDGSQMATSLCQMLHKVIWGPSEYCGGPMTHSASSDELQMGGGGVGNSSN